MIFPDKNYLNDYEGSDFGSLVSTMQVESILGNGPFQLGDSHVAITLEPISAGEEGMEAFKRNCKKIRDAIGPALGTMKDIRYTDFWVWARDDYDKNGVYMPKRGKIL